MFLGFQGLRAAVRGLPLPVAQALGRGMGLAAYGLLRAQRRLTEEHLRLAWGSDLAPDQRRRIARRVFVNLGQTAMEWMLLPRFSTEVLRRLVRSEGVEHLRDALAKGRGVILVTAHFGNWEVIPFYLRSLGFEGSVLARRLRYPEYESFLIDLRRSRGVSTVARGSSSLKEITRLLRANQIVGMLPDQDVDSLDGIFVNFLGRPAYTPIGPAALSLMTGAPIVPCFLAREGRRFCLFIEPALEALPSATRTEAMTKLTQAWSGIVESYIRRYPDHWVWMHRRWKTKPAQVAEGSGVGAEGHGSEPTSQRSQPALALSMVMGSLVLMLAVLGGCGKAGKAASPDASTNQEMSTFMLTGYQDTGEKRWQLEGQGAVLEGDLVTIHHPDAIGYEPGRTAHLTASVAEVRQTDRHVRMEHDVTIHTSDGLWLTTPVLHWIPDRNEMATEFPVRIETDHMLLRGREATGFTQLKRLTIIRDIELVLNPSDKEPLGGGGPRQVTITCDGPLTFDYEHHIATFEQHVHIKDPNGDLDSDKLVAYLDETKHTIRYAEAIGHVLIRQQQNTAHSERAVYEPAIGKITLVGKPTLLVYPSERGRQPARVPFGGLASEPSSK